jgi:hypothetical protein
MQFDAEKKMLPKKWPDKNPDEFVMAVVSRMTLPFELQFVEYSNDSKY